MLARRAAFDYRDFLDLPGSWYAVSSKAPGLHNFSSASFRAKYFWFSDCCLWCLGISAALLDLELADMSLLCSLFWLFIKNEFSCWSAYWTRSVSLDCFCLILYSIFLSILSITWVWWRCLAFRLGFLDSKLAPGLTAICDAKLKFCRSLFSIHALTPPLRSSLDAPSLLFNYLALDSLFSTWLVSFLLPIS